MTTLEAIAALIPTLARRIRAGASASDVQEVIAGLGDAETIAACQEAVEIGRLTEQIQLLRVGQIARRSSRSAGHAGLAQSRGHRSAASLIQELAGTTKSEAARQVRVGEALLEDEVRDDSPAETGDATRSSEPPSSEPSSGDWREPLRTGLRSGTLTSAQFDAIRSGLGDPPEGAAAAWAQAAAQLIEEAPQRTVEELGASARAIRDLLDPEGTQARFDARYERRSFRTWFDHEGVRHASAVFDDEGGAFVDAVFASALRPRRGGPRFVDADENARAADLTADPRTNEQLSYDLLLDLIRAGALAEPEGVFGTRQVGLRLVQTVDRHGDSAPIAISEDGLTALPAAVAERRICEAGAVPVTVDGCGNPLDVGRESRLFTPRQRIGLAIRDGGCRWTGCDRPASYCEAHHIDEWARDNGRTDIDRRILLCRFHHMRLHHGRWRITRIGTDDFVLHDRGGERTTLRPRLPVRYAWGDVDPPPRRFHPAA
ncbi:HNH endonuclease signature motif containing protein [uncultured Microbacterium sp.]|uniref:HNH endonuclease signature motif containing protein n=1 Tax=uncultured Microbacterium sp. TaxID=191216 RepID=UPI0025F0CD87|nr:HNH endonuclease signature motif containing protein [uncultured Microbacterium sp.]